MWHEFKLFLFLGSIIQKGGSVYILTCIYDIIRVSGSKSNGQINGNYQITPGETSRELERSTGFEGYRRPKDYEVQLFSLSRIAMFYYGILLGKGKKEKK